jgi:quercetin dioxygenase-like cupin family protein
MTSVTKPTVTPWMDQEFTEVRPGILGATIDTEQLTFTVYRYGAGSSWEEHRHPEDQVTSIVSGGQITFCIDGEDVTMRPGEVALIPGDVPHSAHVPGEDEVVALCTWKLRDRKGG